MERSQSRVTPFSRLGGAALFPWLAGNIAQRWGLGALLPGVIALAVVMFAIWPALQTGPSAPDAAPAA